MCRYILAIALFLGLIVSSNAFAQCAIPLDISGFNVCWDSSGLSVEILGGTLFHAGRYQGTPPNEYYRIDLEPPTPQGDIWRRLPLGVVRDNRVRIEWNSHGDFANKIIMEICVHDPSYIRVDLRRTQLGRRKCGAWIVLASVPFPR